MKISSGIGKVFLDTIKKTEKIRSARMTNIDPRSAARTPAANKMPKYRLRYDSPAWASPVTASSRSREAPVPGRSRASSSAPRPSPTSPSVTALTRPSSSASRWTGGSRECPALTHPLAAIRHELRLGPRHGRNSLDIGQPWPCCFLYCRF